jgi:Tfp pilus assembly protein PilO
MEKTEKKSIKRVIVGLVLVIVILIGIIGYIFLLKPSLAQMNEKCLNQGRSEGVNYTIRSLIQVASSCQVVSLKDGDQSADLIDVKCLAKTS